MEAYLQERRQRQALALHQGACCPVNQQKTTIWLVSTALKAKEGEDAGLRGRVFLLSLLSPRAFTAPQAVLAALECHLLHSHMEI